MSNKQSVIDAVDQLPDTANWSEIAETLIAVVARNGTEADLARFLRAQMTSEDLLSEYESLPADVETLEDVIAELELRSSTRKSA